MIDTIYIEKDIRTHPKAQRILQQHPQATLIECNHYGEVFNQKAQDFRLQKQQPALILARKKGRLVLPTPPGYGIGGQHNYYFSHMLNCLYDCRYCFLQGMFRSAHYVVFVNDDEFCQAIDQTLTKHPANDKVYFFSGYDADSVAMEHLTGFIEKFVPFFATRPQATLELRTKCAAIAPLKRLHPIPNCVVAFSLLPAEIAHIMDSKTPGISRRLQAIKALSDAGWRIGIRLDPLIYHKNFRALYEQLIHDIFQSIDPAQLHSVSLGPLRFPKAMFDKIYKLDPTQPWLNTALTLQDRNIVSYPQSTEKQMIEFCKKTLLHYIRADQLFACSPTVAAATLQPHPGVQP